MAKCRMYYRKPSKTKEQCLLCARRGGWKVCSRSKNADRVERTLTRQSA